MIDLLLARRPIGELPPEETRIAHSLRLFVVMRKAQRCPMESVAGRLGSLRAAAHFHLLLEEVGTAWPEPFAVSPPCCPRLSHDEATMVDMFRLGAKGDRPGFDRLLVEMLPADERERLFLSFTVLNRAMEQARTERCSGRI